VASALLDTGAVVALINRGDKHHASAARWFSEFRGTLLTTDAVIAETAYVLADRVAHQLAALEWFERMSRGGLLRVESVSDHGKIGGIIERYQDLPCDYADATLIALADQTGIVGVATIDQRDFSVYRAKGKRSFLNLIPRGFAKVTAVG